MLKISLPPRHHNMSHISNVTPNPHDILLQAITIRLDYLSPGCSAPIPLMGLHSLNPSTFGAVPAIDQSLVEAEIITYIYKKAVLSQR